MTKSRKHPFNQAGEAFLALVLAGYLWTALTVLCQLQDINPLLFDLRAEYAKMRGLQ